MRVNRDRGALGSVLAAALVMVLAVGTIVAARLGNDRVAGRSSKLGSTASQGQVETTAEPGGEAWDRLPPGPLEPRVPAASVWTGKEMIVWGGWVLEGIDPAYAGPQNGFSYDPATSVVTPTREKFFADGAAYDPATRSWRSLPEPPIDFRRADALAVWTGTDMVLIGRTVRDPTLSESQPCDRTAGAAYDPASNRWRPIADPPELLDCLSLSVVSSDSSVIAWGGVDHGGAEASPRGAAYDAELDRWDALPPSPLANRQWHSAVWTGTEMVVWGGTDLVGLSGVDEEREGAAYDPASRSWRRLAVPPIAGRYRHLAVWTGREMIVWGGTPGRVDGAAYDPATDTWRFIASSPVAGRHWATALWTGDRMFIWGGYDYAAGEANFGDGATYDPETDSWQVLARSVLAPRCSQAAVWTGNEVLLWGGAGHCGTFGPAHGDGASYRPTPD